MSREEEAVEEEEGIRLTQKDRRVCCLGVNQVLMLLRDEATQRAASVFVYLKEVLSELDQQFQGMEGDT